MPGETVVVSDASFEKDVLQSSEPVLVDFFADAKLLYGHRLGAEHAELFDLELLAGDHQPDLHAGLHHTDASARGHGRLDTRRLLLGTRVPL